MNWNRSLTVEEYRPLKQAVADLGFTTEWVQDVATDTPAPLIGYNMAAAEPSILAAG